MSHYGIVIKIWAEDEDSALQEALNLLEKSCEAPQNDCGWGYVDIGDAYVMTPEEFKKIKGKKIKSFSGLEKHLKQLRLKNKDDLLTELSAKLTPGLAEILMTKSDAPLLIGVENPYNVASTIQRRTINLAEILDQRLKSPKDITVPTFPDIVNKVALAISMAMNPYGVNLVYTLRRLQSLNCCIAFPWDTSYTLQSTDNPYAEITCKDRKNKHPYYIHGARHV